MSRSAPPIDMNRRQLLRVSALAGGGLLLNLGVPGAWAADGGAVIGSTELSAFVQVADDGKITIYAALPEMGQGVKTTLPMIIAEEMGARWADVTVVPAPVDAARFGLQGAGGSTSVPRNIGEMRRVGASAREMLIGAAAQLMEVDRKELKAQDSQVVHLGGRTRSFGQLASLASQQPIPDPEVLEYKDPRSYTIIGTAIGGVDNLVIATGRSEFGIDVEVKGMKYASYTRCPRIGGRALAFNRDAILALPGVVDAFMVAPDDRAGIASRTFLNGLAKLRGGVAVVGDDTWSVLRARRKLQVTWDYGDASVDSWTSMQARARQIAQDGGGKVRSAGKNVDDVLADPAMRTQQSFYEFGYVAHVCMEPMNCTADYRKGVNGAADTLEIWAGSQFPGQIREVAANLLGLQPDNVTLHLTRLGGGFGRRAIHDFAAEAMTISKRAGVPVKLTWDRTNDIHGDFFRAGGFQNMQAAVDGDGKLAAWDQYYIGVTRQDGSPVIGSGFFGNELPLVAMPNARVRQTNMKISTPCGAWRAPGSNTNAFVEQSFLHELAVLGGRDHLQFLLELMGARRWLMPGNVNMLNTGRAIDVLKLVADRGGWGKTMPQGRGQGLAFYFCHAAHIAEIAEVTVDGNRNYSVDRVTVAVDVGPILNLSGAEGQVQGSVIDGISAMAMQRITMENGAIQQDNFDQYPVMRIGATPAIDVHFLQSDNPSTGLGEPALPPLAPAVTNAIFAATGQRIRTLPLTEAGFKLV